ncbi:class I SAM-dependent methyltransferase [Streptococcus equinus]|uniref:class I SAM-dependent methyltransferase n=1 Tax=Streptococcus equinus TaxID=1335 RepID=UPI0015F371FD|nr:class I SAM-dependent methyltransferase [Streptococcus equinus]QMS96659.1 methyltransferase domain-containing protein [Streptococcus equinus]
MVNDSYDTVFFDKELFFFESERLSKSIEINKKGIVRSFNFLNLDNPSVIVDLGCGTGEISLALSKYFPNSKVIGIDREDKFIIENKKKYTQQKNLSFIQSDCYCLPFENNTIDLCYSRFLFQHLRKPDLAIKEIFRILKPKGKVAIFDIDKNLDICYPSPKYLKMFNKAELFYKKLIKNDIFIGRKMIPLLTSGGFNDIAKLDVSIDSLNTKKSKIVDLVESWLYIDFNEHPYVATKKITGNELKEYFEDLLQIIRQKDSYICLGLVFVMGTKNSEG